MATVACVLCGSPVERKIARLTEKRDGLMCGDIYACEMRQDVKEPLPEPMEIKEPLSEPMEIEEPLPEPMEIKEPLPEPMEIKEEDSAQVG